MSISSFSRFALRSLLTLPVLSLAALAAGPAAAQLVEPDAEVIRELRGDVEGDWFGWIVADLGDLNGDGIRDSAVPAIAQDGFSGRVPVFSGADGSLLWDAFGAPGTAFGYWVDNAGDINDDGVNDVVASGGQVQVLSGVDGAVLLDLTGLAAFVDTVTGLGDVDGDGVPDFALGAASAADGAGQVIVASGADGSVIWQRDGAELGDALGAGVSDLEDLNGDGIGDLVASAIGAGATDGGEALVLSGFDGSVIYTLRPLDPVNANNFGAFFVSGTPDMDGDGMGEIFVADFEATTAAGPNTGNVSIYSGRSGRLIRRFLGRTAGERFGLGRGVEDLDGDGRADLVIGAFSQSAAAPMAGATYIYSGRSGALLRTLTSTVENDNFGGDAISAGDVNGDGLPDLISTAPGLSFLGLAPGRALVIAGSVLPCPADISNNGWVGAFDFALLKRRFGDAGGPADLDGSGAVDFGDIAVLIRSLGRCPQGFPQG